MEQLNCAVCNGPRWHQTINFYQKFIHGGRRCLSCGNVIKSIDIDVIRSKPFVNETPLKYEQDEIV